MVNVPLVIYGSALSVQYLQPVVPVFYVEKMNKITVQQIAVLCLVFFVHTTLPVPVD